jgi:hypothetical protein
MISTASSLSAENRSHSIKRKSQREWLTLRNVCAFGKRSKAPVLIESPGGWRLKERKPGFWLNPHFPALPASSVAFYTCLREALIMLWFLCTPLLWFGARVGLKQSFLSGENRP